VRAQLDQDARAASGGDPVREGHVAEPCALHACALRALEEGIEQGRGQGTHRVLDQCAPAQCIPARRGGQARGAERLRPVSLDVGHGAG